VDPLNRSGLIIAIENENVELINILLDAGSQVKVSTHKMHHSESYSKLLRGIKLLL
jgi:hypothetical protein